MTAQSRFPLARMSAPIRFLTALLLFLPVGFLISAVTIAPIMATAAVLIVSLYVWAWLRFRPTCFRIREDGLEVIWPLKRHLIARTAVKGMRILSNAQLKAATGWRFRIGVGGLWGGFGRLRTERRGSVHMFISRLDRFVWIECEGDDPWLITPERPDDFVEAWSRSCPSPQRPPT